MKNKRMNAAASIINQEIRDEKNSKLRGKAVHHLYIKGLRSARDSAGKVTGRLFTRRRILGKMNYDLDQIKSRGMASFAELDGFQQAIKIIEERYSPKKSLFFIENESLRHCQWFGF